MFRLRIGGRVCLVSDVQRYPARISRSGYGNAFDDGAVALDSVVIIRRAVPANTHLGMLHITHFALRERRIVKYVRVLRVALDEHDRLRAASPYLNPSEQAGRA